MSMALSALRTRSKILANDQNARILTSAQYDLLINDALEEWATRTESLLRENAFSVTAKQQVIDAPNDVIRLKKAWWLQNGYYPLETVGESEFMWQGGDYLNHGPGQPAIIKVEHKLNSNKFRIFPAAPATSETTTLNGAITALATTITLADVSGIRAGAWFQVDSEKIYAQELDTTNLQLKQCIRGVGNTSGASHSSGATITQLDLHAVYVRSPASLASDADTPEIDDDNHKCLCYYVAAEVLHLDGRDNRDLVRRWEQAVRRAKFEESRQMAGSPNFILPGGY